MTTDYGPGQIEDTIGETSIVVFLDQPQHTSRVSPMPDTMSIVPILPDRA